MSTPSNTSTTNPSTGIRVIVIGAGFGGLTAAIECYQRGHSVTLLEAFPELKPLGDIITFGSNSARIFSRWPGVLEQINSAIVHCDGIEFKTFHGKYLLKQLWKDEPAWGETFNGHRGEIHEIIFNHAKSLGIDIRLNHKVVDCFESDTEAGVIVENGQIFTGDVVLAADGVHSTARKILLKYDDHPRDSGYSVYRSWFDSTELAKNPLIAPLVNNGDTYSAWIGPNAHFLALSWKGGKQFVWICMHKDNSGIRETLASPVKVEDAIKTVEGWDAQVHAIIRASTSIINWKLVMHDPLPTWLSPKRRIALLGDAAHPFLPSSQQGASQAVEDGVTLAVCLLKAGREKIPEALSIYEKMRYDRVRQAQTTGVTARDRWHEADYSRVHENPESIKMVLEGWILNHDSEEQANATYNEVLASLH